MMIYRNLAGFLSVLMMTCSAFAESSHIQDALNRTVGYITIPSNAQQPIFEACSGEGTDPLYLDGELTSGTVTFKADWTPNKCMITLDSNTGTGSANPSTLYTTYDVGAYLDSDRDNLMTTSTYGLTSVPTGSSVTVHWNLNAGNDTSVSPASIADNTLNKSFTGFYGDTDATSDVYISPNAGYYITSEGHDVAKGLNEEDNTCNTTWYAGWKCPKVTLPDEPSRTGYAFQGWYNGTGDNASVVETNTEACAETTFYAHWDPNKYTVSYECGNNATLRSDSSEHQAADSVTYDVDYAFRPGTGENSFCVSTNGGEQNGWECFASTNSSKANFPFYPWYDSYPWNNNINTNASGEYGVNGTGDVTTSVTCVAKWNNQITLLWNTQGGEMVNNNVNSSTCVYSTGNIDQIYAPHRKGYTFVGWQVADHTN